MLRHARLRRSRRRLSAADSYYLPAGAARIIERGVPEAPALNGRERADIPPVSPPVFPLDSDRDAGLSIIPGLGQPFPAQDVTAPADALEGGSPAQAMEPEPDWLVADSPTADTRQAPVARPQADPAGTGDALVVSGQPDPATDSADADDMPVFHRVRSSPTPPPADDPSLDAGNDAG
jgi:hypothetical protein